MSSVDPAFAFLKAAEEQRPDVDGLGAIGDFLEADVRFGEHVTHVDPLLLPTNPAVATDAPAFKVRRVVEAGDPSRVCSGCTGSISLPTNKRLLDPRLDRRSAEAAVLLVRWGRLHGVRSVASGLAFGVLAWHLAQ